MELKWNFQNENASEKMGVLYYYDCGAYVGFLFEDDWTCYHILSRSTSEDGNILEIVEKMPDDWVPRHVYSIEELDIYEKTCSSFKVKSWLIELPLWEQEQQRGGQQQQLQSRSPQGQGKDRGQGRNRHPHTYNPPSSRQEQPQRRQQHHEQHPPSPQSYHQQHTSYSQQKMSSQHQQQKSHQPRKERTALLSQSTSNTGEAVSPLSSSDSAYREKHQLQRQSQRERQMSQSKLTAHNGPQWTSLQSLLSTPALALPHAVSPKPVPRPLLPNPSSESPSNPVRHSREQPTSHRQKSKHLQRPGGSSKQRPRHLVSPQSVPQGSPSM